MRLGLLSLAVVGIAIFVGAPACGAFSGSDSSAPTSDGGGGSTADSGPQADAASVDDAGNDDPTLDDAGPSAPPVSDDAGTTEAGTPTCSLTPPPKTVAVKAATDGVVCANKSASQLVALQKSDGLPVGLDLKVGGVAVQIDGKNVTACIGVDFGKAITGARIRVRGVGSACGVACNGACGTGDTSWVFAGASPGSLKTVTHLVGTSTWQTFAITAADSSTQVVVVCRAGFAAADDDIEVDSILACE